MSKQKDNDFDYPEDTTTWVWLPDEGVYGTIVRYGAWASMINYYDNGVSYTVEVANDDFIVIDEGIGYSEEEEGIGYLEEEDDYLE